MRASLQGTSAPVRDVLAVASLVTVGFMGSVIVTPLYALYEQKFGFSEITPTLVYAVYVVGNIVALLVFGQVSDQQGRKRVALPALGLAASARSCSCSPSRGGRCVSSVSTSGWGFLATGWPRSRLRPSRGSSRSRSVACTSR